MSWAMKRDTPVRARLLWAHVLRRAVFDYVLYKGIGARKLDWQRAFQYIFLEDQDYGDGLSFKEVCALFNWDPEYVRRLASKLNRSDIKRMEADSIKDEFTEDILPVIFDKAGKWKTLKTALPFYPRMVDEFVHMDSEVVYKEEHSQGAPIVSWDLAESDG